MKPQITLPVRAEANANQGYSRREVLRILHLKGSQLSSWERTGLISFKQLYHFADIGLLRALREARIPARKLRASISAMQHRFGVRNPLLETTAVRRGSSVSFRHNGSLVDPISLQLAFDFDFSETELLGTMGKRAASHTNANPLVQILEVQEKFQAAVQLEEDPGTIEEAAEIYRGILVLRPEHAPACINLGTIHYNRRDFRRAEQLYRQATVADPEYALAFFDLGNVLDETLHLNEAIAAYRRAVELVPQYADAHYNLALAYERQNERRRALRHWLIYTRLDPIGPWATHAKLQARKILNTERLSIVSRRGRMVPIAG